MLRILFIWILGICIDYFFVIPALQVLTTFVCLVISYIIIKSPLFQSLVVLLCWFLLSIAYNQSFFEYKHLGIPFIAAFSMKISKSAKQKPKTWEVIGDLKQIKVANHWQKPPVEWKVKCYFSKKLAQPKLGQIWFVADSIKQFDQPAFDFEKNWKDYYVEKGIIGSVFVHSNNAKVLRPFAKIPITSHFRNIQRYFLKGFEFISDNANREVAEAMVLGESDGIDSNLQEAYTNLGAIHMLSVSGMHLGILFVVIHFLFQKIEKLWPKVKFISFIMLLLILWGYAGITGFSAPVLRATWVFSLVLLARFFLFPINSLNLLACSCWFILLCNPYDLLNPGFQLSYLAVLGLIFFQKSITQTIRFNKKKWWGTFLHYLWESTSVAIAAQILTLPLVIFYFHQMPNPVYFFLLNPLLMVLSSIALVLGFILIGIYPISQGFDSFWLISSVGKLTNFFFEVLHQCMLYFSSGKSSVFSFLNLSLKDICLIYLLLFLIILWLKFRKSYVLWLLNGLMFYFIFEIVFLFPSQIENQRYQKIVEFRKETIGIKIVKNKMLVLGPSKFILDRKWFSSHLVPMAAHFFIKDTFLIDTDRLNKFKFFDKKKL